MSNQAEIWKWVGVSSSNEFGTYNTRDYIAHPIKNTYKNIHTISDLKSFLQGCPEDAMILTSPTSCYFDFDNGPVFYRDQQDCVVWALDDVSGRVYIPPDEDNQSRRYVAANLGEFLSHIEDDHAYWFNNDFKLNVIGMY